MGRVRSNCSGARLAVSQAIALLAILALTKQASRIFKCRVRMLRTRISGQGSQRLLVHESLEENDTSEAEQATSRTGIGQHLRGDPSWLESAC